MWLPHVWLELTRLLYPQHIKVNLWELLFSLWLRSKVKLNVGFFMWVHVRYSEAGSFTAIYTIYCHLHHNIEADVMVCSHLDNEVFLENWLWNKQRIAFVFVTYQIELAWWMSQSKSSQVTSGMWGNTFLVTNFEQIRVSIFITGRQGSELKCTTQETQD